MHNAIVIWIGVRILIFLGYYICSVYGFGRLQTGSQTLFFINQKKSSDQGTQRAKCFNGQMDNVEFTLSQKIADYIFYITGQSEKNTNVPP